jgi:hypothetical protein
MRGFMVSCFAVALAAAGATAVFGEEGADLNGTWTLEERSSDDPVQELRGGGSGEGNGLGKQIVRGVSIFGVPVGGLALPDDQDEEEDEDDAADTSLRGVEHVFESTFRIIVTQNEDATEIRYGSGPSMIYRHASRVEREDGSVVRSDWQNDRLSVEHELANGTRVSERYWVESRTGELSWTVRLKRDNEPTVDVKRVFYRAPGSGP